MVPRRAAPQPAPGEQLTEILEHVEFPALPEMGDPQDGVLLVVNVYHVDLPAACGSEWEGQARAGRAPPLGLADLGGQGQPAQLHSLPTQWPALPGHWGRGGEGYGSPGRTTRLLVGEWEPGA